MTITTFSEVGGLRGSFEEVSCLRLGKCDIWFWLSCYQSVCDAMRCRIIIIPYILGSTWNAITRVYVKLGCVVLWFPIRSLQSQVCGESCQPLTTLYL